MNYILSNIRRPCFYHQKGLLMQTLNICRVTVFRFCCSQTPNFEKVFSFPTIKYIALINRLKVYQIIGSCIAIPSCGIMEMLDLVQAHTFLTTAYIGLTGLAILSLGTVSFNNVIGHLYISDDNKHIKISSVDFWGKRKDRIISVDEWIPLLDMKPKTMDAFFLSPQLTDGTKYKLPIKFGNVFNSQRMGHILE